MTDSSREALTVVDLEQYDPGDGHFFWRATLDYHGVVLVAHDRWGRWQTDDFTAGEPHELSGWVGDRLDQAVVRKVKAMEAKAA